MAGEVAAWGGDSPGCLVFSWDRDDDSPGLAPNDVWRVFSLDSMKQI